MPDWLEAVVLAAAAWRTFHLIAHDDGPFNLLDKARRYVTRLGTEWEEDGDQVPDNYRSGLADFITCPFCAGLWISGAWVGLWALAPGVAFWAGLVLAVNAAVIAAALVAPSD